MKVKIFLAQILLVGGLMILSACAPATPLEPSTPEEIPYPQPAPAEPLQPANPEGPYPYPAPQEQAHQPGGLGEPYPAPQDVIDGDTSNGDPYPGIETTVNPSNWDLSQAITPDEFAVQPNDDDLHTGPVFIDQSEIIMKESYPVQVELVIVGNLPTPCNQLRIVRSEPDENGHIEIETYSVSDPDMICSQVLKPFIAVLPLGEYTEGAFTFSINKEINGEFRLP